MNYEKILAGLRSTKSTIVFKNLCALNSDIIDERAYLPLKNIAENGTTFKNKKLAFELIKRHFFECLNSINFRTNTTLGYIYFVKERLNGYVKIGRSQDLEKRFQIFAVKLPFEIQLFHYIKTYNFEKIELELHEYYASKRAKGEWFKLNEEDIKNILANSFPERILNLITTNLPKQQIQNSENLTNNFIDTNLNSICISQPIRQIQSSENQNSIKAKSYSLEEVRLNYKDAYRPWSVQLDQELTEMYLNGLKSIDIAKYFGRTLGAIKSRIKKLELEEFYGKRKI
jgi:hypothetical protein